jgi:hypothetical protein
MAVEESPVEQCVIRALERRNEPLSEAELMRECKLVNETGGEAEFKRALRHLIAEGAVRRCDDGKVCPG